VKADLISSGNFAEITRLTKESIFTMLGFEFAHLGINEKNKDKALNSANLLSHLFYFPIKNGPRNIVFKGGLFLNRYNHKGQVKIPPYTQYMSVFKILQSLLL
ncbi:MAG: hypothetical protein ABH830_00005, partial [Patescibacteria group bacterium]